MDEMRAGTGVPDGRAISGSPDVWGSGHPNDAPIEVDREFLDMWRSETQRRWPGGGDLTSALADLVDPSTCELHYLDRDIRRRLLRRAHAVPGGLVRALNYLRQMGFVTRCRPIGGRHWSSISLTFREIQP